MMFQHVLGTSLEHVAFLGTLEHSAVTEYFRDYVQNVNRNQATQNAWLRGYACVAAWVLRSHQFPWCEAKRAYVLAWKANQSEQTQKSPHKAGAKKPQLRGFGFSYR